MAITLCGFPVSNYYNKVKLALLEKNVPFDERSAFPSDDAGFRAASPRGKVPFIEVDGATLCESQAIVEYLEDAYPAVPLYPRDALERARIRSLIQIMELYVELVARRLYGAALFGLPIPPGQKEQTAEDLKLGVAALARVVRFSPYIGGETLTLADVAAVWHLPLVRWAMQRVYGDDPLAGLSGLGDYLAMIQKRSNVVACEAARTAGVEPFVAAVKKKYGLA